MTERYITPSELAETLSREARALLAAACTPAIAREKQSAPMALVLSADRTKLMEAGLVVPDGPQLWATPLGRVVHRIISEEPARAPERSAAGRVWLDLVLKHRNALMAGNETRRAELLALTSAIEAEYPAEIAAERALWAPADAG